jgi:hypothetical protein
VRGIRLGVGVERDIEPKLGEERSDEPLDGEGRSAKGFEEDDEGAVGCEIATAGVFDSASADLLLLPYAVRVVEDPLLLLARLEPPPPAPASWIAP